MPHDLSPAAFELQPIEGWLASDSRTIAFTVQLADGSGKDIAEDTLSWALLEKPYASDSDAVVDDSDSGVTITKTDTAAGEFEVVVAEGTVTDEWGTFTQRVTVDPPDDTRQTWSGDVVISD